MSEAKIMNETEEQEVVATEHPIPKARIYREIKMALNRMKNDLIDQTMNERSNMEDIIEDVEDIIEGYEQFRMAFKYLIFEGYVPDEYMISKDEDSTESDEVSENEGETEE